MDRLVDFLLTFYGPTPYLLVLAILLACGFGLPLPEDITLFAAGLLSYYGVTKLGVMIAICLFGVLVGDTIVFWLGYYFGRRLTKRWFFHRILPDERLNYVSKQLNAKGTRLIFAARFMPGLRSPFFFSAGALHVPFRTFIFYDGIAAFISVPSIIGAVYYFGDELDRVVRVIQRVEHGLAFGAFGLLFVIIGKWYLGHRKLKRKTLTS
ncbi:DedA family protein [Bdellovibrionota bacterium FG-2]